jgi:hypothetical protein
MTADEAIGVDENELHHLIYAAPADRPGELELEPVGLRVSRRVSGTW